MARLQEPARTKLFWLPIYKVVLGIIRDLMSDLYLSCAEFADGKKKAIWIAIIPLLCIAYPFLAVTCVLIFVFSMAITLLNYVAGAIVFIIDTAYLKIKRIGVSCKDCQHKFDIPIYICPTCGQEHRSLRPGRYGIFFRRCACGKKLGSTLFTGRHKYDYKCPNCGKVYKGTGLTHSITIPVIGGPSSGKTCYVTMAINRMSEIAADYKLSFKLETKNSTQEYENNVASMKNGKVPDKTNDDRLNYYQFYLSKYKNKVKNLVSVCDVAGELFQTTDNVAQQAGFKNSRQFLLIIDPLSINEFKVTLKNDVSKSYGSVKSMDEVLNVLIYTLENSLNKQVDSKFNCDIAVVINKCDIKEVDDEIGKARLKEALDDQSLGLETELDALNYLCESFLQKYHEDNLLMQLKSKFNTIQFFTVSALGHEANDTAFSPVNVEDPILWLIDRDSQSIDLKAKWHKTV